MTDLYLDLFFTGMVKSTLTNPDSSVFRGINRMSHEYAARIYDTNSFGNIHLFGSRLPTMAKASFVTASGRDLLQAPENPGFRETCLHRINLFEKNHSDVSGALKKSLRTVCAILRRVVCYRLLRSLYVPEPPSDDSIWLSMSTLLTTEVRALKCIRVLICHDLNQVFHYREMGNDQPSSSILDNQALNIRNDEWVICISDYSRSCFLKYHTSFPPERAFVVPLGADLQPPHTSTGDHGILSKYKLEKGTYFLTLAAGAPHKNSSYIVEEFVDWLRTAEVSNSFKLVLAGAGQESIRSRLSPGALAAVSSGRVVFTGFVPDAELPLLYQHCMAFVFASLAEGFGLPPLEAMAQGAPVICSDRTSLPEVVGEAGLLFNPVTKGALSSALNKIHRTPALRESLIEKGLERASHFTWARSTNQLLETLLEIRTRAIEERARA